MTPNCIIGLKSDGNLKLEVGHYVDFARRRFVANRAIPCSNNIGAIKGMYRSEPFTFRPPLLGCKILLLGSQGALVQSTFEDDHSWFIPTVPSSQMPLCSV